MARSGGLDQSRSRVHKPRFGEAILKGQELCPPSKCIPPVYPPGRVAALQAPAGVIGALKALRDRPDATPGLGQIVVPTLVLVGRDDALTPPAQAEALAAAVPGAKLAVLDGAGHLANLERPDAFTDAVRAFLRGLPA